ncbi:MAG: DUF3109 family protein [Bacteroidales bacterium]
MYSSKDFPIIEIDNKLISTEILTEYFSCNYDICKGVCCIAGDSGAPLLDKERKFIKKNYSYYKSLISPAGQSAITKHGFSMIDIDGDMVTPLIENSEACAYSLIENGHYYCALERAYITNLIPKNVYDFIKPISCRLYPIRISKLSDGTLAFNLHHWEICKGAFEKGKKEGIRVFEFLRTPLISFYGKDFYSALKEASKIFTASK